MTLVRNFTSAFLVVKRHLLSAFQAPRMMTAARPPSLAIDISDDVTNDHLESPRSALAFEIEVEGQNSPIPKGLEKRLAERSETVKSWSNEEIDQKLILAERRRFVQEARPLF